MISVPSALAVSIAPLAKASVAVSVPLVVTGELVIVNADGRERPTDVTVPLPPPLLPLIHVPDIT
jgi:hypothetical protein